MVGVAVATLVALLFIITPSPYVIEQPGPVFDTLGTVEIGDEKVALISISGAMTYPTDGELNLLTVSVVGNPDSRLSWVEAGLAWFDSKKALVPIELVFPPGETADQRQEQDAAAMSSSQESAIAAALTHLGYELNPILTVSLVPEEAPAFGLVETGDVIIAANGVKVSTVESLREQVQNAEGNPVTLDLVRAGEATSVVVTPAETDGVWLLGIGATTSYDFPFDVSITLDDVGGPSAGLMFALGIVDKLTPNELTQGDVWAGTGTISGEGVVGPIGGIRQKMLGARDAGALYMLAPRENCDEVIGHIPDGLEVFAVSTLSEAEEVVVTASSGADTSQLGRCVSG